MDDIMSIAIVVMRVGCIVAFGAMLIHSIYRLVYEDTHSDTRETRFFVVMLLSAIEYASCISIYLQANPDIPDNMRLLQSFIAAFLFFAAALFGLKVFMPWKIK